MSNEKPREYTLSAVYIKHLDSLSYEKLIKQALRKKKGT